MRSIVYTIMRYALVFGSVSLAVVGAGPYFGELSNAALLAGATLTAANIAVPMTAVWCWRQARYVTALLLWALTSGPAALVILLHLTALAEGYRPLIELASVAAIGGTDTHAGLLALARFTGLTYEECVWGQLLFHALQVQVAQIWVAVRFAPTTLGGDGGGDARGSRVKTTRPVRTAPHSPGSTSEAEEAREPHASTTNPSRMTACSSASTFAALSELIGSWKLASDPQVNEWVQEPKCETSPGASTARIHSFGEAVQTGDHAPYRARAPPAIARVT